MEKKSPDDYWLDNAEGEDEFLFLYKVLVLVSSNTADERRFYDMVVCAYRMKQALEKAEKALNKTYGENSCWTVIKIEQTGDYISGDLE